MDCSFAPRREGGERSSAIASSSKSRSDKDKWVMFDKVVDAARAGMASRRPQFASRSREVRFVRKGEVAMVM
jgi:hypothetical protein